jgi:hypothetical protein
MAQRLRLGERLALDLPMAAEAGRRMSATENGALPAREQMASILTIVGRGRFPS